MAKIRRPQNSKKRATVTVTNVVEVRIQGYYQQEPGDVLPRVRDDDGLVGDLLSWQLDNEVYSWHTPHTGAGQMLAYYEPDDAAKVIAWLKEHNKRDDNGDST